MGVLIPLLLSLFLFASASASAAADDDQPSVYEALQRYDFPVGILPKGVTGYDLNQATGEFSAYLNSTCSFSIKNSYDLSYRSTISGVISRGRLRKLKGVKVKLLFLWLDIVEVRRKGYDLEFSVGIASANFGIDNFEESPQCGCGFDCDGGGIGKGRIRNQSHRSVSSSSYKR